jgi:3-deoxy-7-phosphoheptulonate synthase
MVCRYDDGTTSMALDPVDCHNISLVTTTQTFLLFLFSDTTQSSCLNVVTEPPRTSSSTFSSDSNSESWSPISWKNKNVSQPPNYQNEAELEAAMKKLGRCSPLVFAGEVRTLHEQLARACSGQGFLLMGGDCAEAFEEFNVDHVRDSFRVLLQMALVLTFGSAMPVIKVGRMAGQFAKPRSEPDEVRDGVTLPSYRGDIINSEDFTEEARRHNPWNMVEAYHQSAQTLNILRAFSTGGYADISRLHAWNLDFVEQTDEGSRSVVFYAQKFCILVFQKGLDLLILCHFLFPLIGYISLDTANSPPRSTNPYAL